MFLVGGVDLSDLLGIFSSLSIRAFSGTNHLVVLFTEYKFQVTSGQKPDAIFYLPIPLMSIYLCVFSFAPCADTEVTRSCVCVTSSVCTTSVVRFDVTI